MMKMNDRLYQYLIILFALGLAPFVLASDNSVDNKKEQAEMPPAPSGPYRAQPENNEARKKTVNNMQRSAQQLAQRPPQQMRPLVAPPAWVNKAPQPQRMAPNRNRNIPPQAQWKQPRPQQIRPPIMPRAWVNQVPPQQRRAPNLNRNVPPQAQWNQRPPQQQRMIPNQNRNFPPQAQWKQRPPQKMRPPVWTSNAPQQRAAPNWNRNVSPQAQWQQPKVPEWVTNPSAPPAWVNNAPHQRMQARPVPGWVKNQPYGPKPPAWVTNPPQQPMYQYDHRGR